MRERREGAVTMKGAPMTLLGPEIEPNEDAPEFTALKNLTTPTRLSDSTGKVRIILSVPSLDTAVCALETRRFNQEVKDLTGDVEVLVVSVDTPFAQKRFCDAESIQNVTPLSDFRHRDFGRKYGVEIEELGIYARAAFVVDRQGVVVYSEYVPEVANEPNYNEVLNAARAAI